ncbi:MAG: hypothetical protein HY369_03390 [Candidatus Aenigmarchaeota archaeon]|nr:hypothetical protein [Candidatus Aenigmarchaeota archaeon]
MEFQILDVDYVVVNDRPIVRMFGKTAAGKSVCAFVEHFLPYFYLRSPAPAPERALKVEQVRRKDIATNREAEFTRVTIANPAQTPEFRDAALAAGAEVFEADILFKYRFLNDRDFRGLGWVQVEDFAEVGTHTVAVDLTLAAKKLAPLNREADAPLKTLAFDIECVSIQPGDAPDARRDPVIMISLACSPAHEGEQAIVLATRPGPGVRYCESEKALLEEFISFIKAYDPDIVTGFNCNNFDFPYLLERMEKNEVRPIFGRCATKRVMARKVAGRFKVTMAGRVIVDSFEIVKKDFSLQRYNLDSVADRLLGKKKVGVKHSEIERLWKGPAQDYHRLVEYSRVDAELALELVTKLNLLDKYAGISKIAGTLLQDTLEGGETTRIEHVLLRAFNKEGYVFPCKPNDRQVAEREAIKQKGFEGGYVIEPVRKLHANVVVLDFKSMYPSIIRSFNICPTTLSPDGDHQSPWGARFLAKEKRQGIIPRILEELMNERQVVKKKLRVAAGPERRVLYAKQWGLKILANAFYGYLGYTRARVFNIDVANSITSYGREIIKKTADRITREFGYEVVYGDTDSVFVVIPGDVDVMAAKATEVAGAVTKSLPGVMELEFEKIFMRFLPLSKKRYAAWKFVPALKEGAAGWEDGIETKGIETVRRDWCPLVGETLQDVIQLILKQDDVKGAVQLFKGIITSLVNGNIPVQKLVVTKTMTKSARHYLGVQPHIELVKKMQARSPQEAPGIGDRVAYVIVKGTELLSKRAEDPGFVAENGLQIDSQYYIENQLLPPLERIFASLNITKSELLGNGRQMGLMDILRARPAVVEPATLPSADVRGFACERCGQFYATAPLLGVCTCGGKLRFTSPKGQADAISINAAQ